MNYEPFRFSQDGWYIIVRNRQFGPWPDKGSAIAGYQTELRRAEAREEKIKEAQGPLPKTICPICNNQEEPHVPSVADRPEST
jgi:hypothetical protein